MTKLEKAQEEYIDFLTNAYNNISHIREYQGKFIDNERN